jgi:hypothetical protein
VLRSSYRILGGGRAAILLVRAGQSIAGNRRYKELERQVTPAGNVYKAIEQGLVEASLVSYTERADHPWTCQLNRGPRRSGSSGIRRATANSMCLQPGT